MRIQLGQAEIEGAIRESIQDLLDTEGRTVTITFTRRGKVKSQMELVADIDIVEASAEEAKAATPPKGPVTRRARKAATEAPVVVPVAQAEALAAVEATDPAPWEETEAAEPVAATPDIFGSSTPTAPEPAELPPPAADGKISLFG